MLETTENVNLFLPIIFTLFISFGVGRLFNRSMYVSSVQFKNIPFLVESAPRCNQHLTAADIMSRDVTTLRKRNQVFHMAEVIRETDYNCFPIVDHLYKVVGTISRHNLMAILRKADILDDEVPKG